MIDAIKELWRNKKDSQGRIDITIFFINIFLIITHIFLMVIYIIVQHNIMMIINAISLLYYVLWIFHCYKYKEHYISYTFLEIWIHMLFGLISFGWHASFQNWIFALIVGTFLPSYKSNIGKPNYRRAFTFSSIIIVSYFVFAVLIYVVDFGLYQDISPIILRTLFTFNNTVSFLSIILFSIFYTIRNESRVHELTRKAEYDELTSLYNRHALQDIAESFKESALRSKRGYSLAIIDIDFFKKINDTYGHTSGDIVLKELANLLRQYAIKGIVPGRWGGEEFIMIAPENIDYSEFTIILEKLREKIEKTTFTVEDNKKIKMTISIGSSIISGKKTLDDAVSMVDKKLYEAKETGRNKLVS